MSINLTDEQKDIISTDVGNGQVMKISAFAGCAKTTTLVEYVRARPEKSFLYIVYNKSAAQHASNVFPANATCRNIHALAYKNCGYQYQHKLKDLRPFILKDHMGVAKYAIGKFLIEVVNNFFSSVDKTIEEKHLVLNDEQTLEEYKATKEVFTVDYLLNKARELWARMKDVKDNNIPMSHDGYLKLFHLSEPVLEYDYILLDEAHDTNPVALDIFLKQKCARIFVGDGNQSMYGFRRATDAMQTKADIEKTLSTSFRFGANIAGVANVILKNLNKEKNKVIGFKPSDAIGEINTNKPYTVISRTNAGLLSEAIHTMNHHPTKSLGFIGTVEKEQYSPFNPYYFSKILDIYYLYANKKAAIKDLYIKRFPSFDSFEATINDKDAPDIELLARTGIVKQYKYDVPDLLDTIVRKSVNPTHADVCFGTTHKAKGLEWNQIKLSNDFETFTTIDEVTQTKRLKMNDEFDKEEVNILYVAVTRAKESLQINTSVTDLLSFCK